MDGQQWVAVIDDDESLRRSIVRLLRTVDFDARGFGSAEEFLGLVNNDCPTCALVDIYLGHGLNGYELKEQLDATGFAFPIVFMTAQVELPVRMQQDSSAIATCLRKPFGQDDLLRRLAPHLDAAPRTADA